MTKLESLDTLRDRNFKPGYRGEKTLEMIADEIQAEVDSRYMLLPVDADGVPIQVADYLRFCDFDIQCAAVSPERVYYWDEYSDAHWVKGCECHHVKPRTVEDVLREFAKSGTPTGDGGVLFETALIEKYADELQMRGDAE